MHACTKCSIYLEHTHKYAAANGYSIGVSVGREHGGLQTFEGVLAFGMMYAYIVASTINCNCRLIRYILGRIE